ncbi:MAG: flavin reductase family protein [Planctomycetota bacterium]
MIVDPTNLDPRDIYRLMISVIVPRPIAWVSTQSPDGVTNAAPFSYFQALGSKPPMVMIAVGDRRTGEAKDTRRNIEATGQFVVNVVDEANGPAMVRCAIDHPYGVSEFEDAGLDAVASERVAPPRIGQSRVAFECELDRVLELAGSGVCIGRIVLFHLDDAVVDGDGHVDPVRLRPLGRLGGKGYATMGALREIDPHGHDAIAWSVRDEMRARVAALRGERSDEEILRDLGLID